MNSMNKVKFLNFLCPSTKQVAGTNRGQIIQSIKFMILLAISLTITSTDLYGRDDSKMDINHSTANEAVAQQSKVSIQGTIKDAQGEPIIGATVIVVDTQLGTSTDIDGNFQLNVPAPVADKVLKVSYLGYSDSEYAIGNKTNFDIVLSDSSVVEMDDVVVTALGIKRQSRSLSYNVQQVEADELTKVKDVNFMNSMVGKVAGVQINSGPSGAGSGVRVVMRGDKSVNKNNNALYVIDGIPMSNNSVSSDEGSAMGGTTSSEGIADINPDDIESISMLTGPSAAALYGSKAANGVVLITTKRGNSDRTVVTIGNNTTFSTVTQLPEMQNSYGTSNGFSSWGEKYASNYDPAKFFNTGVNLINNVSVSTGKDKNQTYFSASSTNSTGIIPESKYERYNVTARHTTTFAKDKLTWDFGGSFIVQNDDNMVGQGKYWNPLPSLYLFPRSDDFNEIRLFERWDPVQGYMTQYWPYGDGAHSLQNPYWIQNRMQRDNNKLRYMFDASLKWDIAEWVNVAARGRVDNSNTRSIQRMYASTLTTFAGVNGGYRDAKSEDSNYYGDIIVNLNKAFNTTAGCFTTSANIGASIEDTRYDIMGAAGDLKIANVFTMNNMDLTKNYKPIQAGWHDQVQSIFAAGEIGWEDTLFLSLTGRSEWPSQLAYTNTSAYFYYSAGLSGVITNLVKMPEWVSFLKVRASFADIASPFDRFLSNPGYSFNDQTHSWNKPTVFPADNLKPENTRSWELGFNTRLLNNRFNIDFTWYRSNTFNQTIFAPIPASSGYSEYIIQTGNIQNSGVELLVGYDNQWGDFRWSSSYTFTHNNNKIIELAGGTMNPVTGETVVEDEIKKNWLGQSNVAPQIILKEGGSMSDIYIYNELARDLNGNIYVNPSTGALSMENYSDSGKEPVKAGSLAPKFLMGWNNTFSYKGVDLGVVVSARVGGKVYSATQGILDFYGLSKVSADARDAGGININKGQVPAETYYTAIATAEGGYGAYYLYDATNVRLQEMSVSYTLPRKWFNNKLGLSVGLVAKNLCMIYNKAPFDPEITPSTSNTYYQGVDYFMQPSTRNIGFNVKMQF